MRAAGLDYDSRTLVEFELPEPDAPGPGEALLEIVEVGICATDRELSHFHFGRPPAGESRMALGHEALARVLAVGPGVDSLAPGTYVAPMIREGCGLACRGCGGGRADLCETGQYRERGIVGMHGYLTARVVDWVARLIQIPARLVETAVLIEPLSVVEKAMETAWRVAVAPPRNAVVFGAGPVGLLTVLALRQRGVEVVCRSLEPEDDPRAALARRAGAEYRHATRPLHRSDLVIEASGSAAAGAAAFESLGPSGSLLLIGAADFDLRFPGIRTVVENQTVAGVVNAGRRHFEAALQDLAAFDSAVVRALIGRRALHTWREAIAGRATPSAIKTVLPLH